MTRLALAPGWLAGAVPGGVVCVLGGREIEIAFDATAEQAAAVVAALAAGCDAGLLAQAAGATDADAAGMLDLLAEHGALVPGGPPAPVGPAPLAAAINDALAGRAVERAWTADELLILPRAPGAELTRRVVRAFVSGLRPGARLAAYAEVAAGGGAITGDAPDAGAVARALAVARDLDGKAIHVVALDGGETVTVTPAELGRLGFDAPHRLGPLAALQPTAPGAGGRATAAALHVPASLRHARPERDRYAHGTGEHQATAGLIARAEAAERYAMGDATAVTLERGRPGEVPGPVVVPHALHRWSARQLADHPERRAPGDERLWATAIAPDGTAHRVPAEAVLLPFDDPWCGRTMEQTSSGVAAHTTFAAAAGNAVLELVERDALLWTWIQRVSRERVDPASLPPATRTLHAALGAGGRRVDLVNLTLDTSPVILVVTRAAGGLTVTAAAAPDAAAAAARALGEAAMLVASLGAAPGPPVQAEDVVTPDDHLARHRAPRAMDDAAFLTASPDVIAVEEVRGLPGPPLETVRAVADPLLVDLTSRATRPFHVVRALVPGLVPLSFGWDHEPLGLPRLARPVALADGRVLGRDLDLEHAGPVPPHPLA